MSQGGEDEPAQNDLPHDQPEVTQGGRLLALLLVPEDVPVHVLGARAVRLLHNCLDLLAQRRGEEHPEYGYVTPLETRALATQDLTPAA